MEQIERIGISLEKNLLADFDKLIKKKGYQNRSQAVRNLINQQLGCEKIQNPTAKTIAAVYLVYDHHATKLMQKLTELQHTNLLKVVCSTHIHLDKHNCMELIVLKGQTGQINRIAESLLSLKGIKLGKINFVPTE